jgi:ribonuclease P/MRP protein subunit POP5
LRRLPSSLRHRKRYIAFRLIAFKDDFNPDKRDVALKILENLISLFGETGSAHSGVWLEYFNGEYGIVKCNSVALDKVKMAITLLNEMDGVRVLPVILGVSGTIKKCKIKYLEVFKNAITTDGIR